MSSSATTLARSNDEDGGVVSKNNASSGPIHETTNPATRQQNPSSNALLYTNVSATEKMRLMLLLAQHQHEISSSVSTMAASAGESGAAARNSYYTSSSVPSSTTRSSPQEIANFLLHTLITSGGRATAVSPEPRNYPPSLASSPTAALASAPVGLTVDDLLRYRLSSSSTGDSNFASTGHGSSSSSSGDTASFDALRSLMFQQGTPLEPTVSYLLPRGGYLPQAQPSGGASARLSMGMSLSSLPRFTRNTNDRDTGRRPSTLLERILASYGSASQGYEDLLASIAASSSSGINNRTWQQGLSQYAFNRNASLPPSLPLLHGNNALQDQNRLLGATLRPAGSSRSFEPARDRSNVSVSALEQQLLRSDGRLHPSLLIQQGLTTGTTASMMNHSLHFSRGPVLTARDNAEEFDVSGPKLESNEYPIDLPAILALPEDNLRLSLHQVFLRQQIEAFRASKGDTLIHKRGRNKPIDIDQVGIRCRHCAHIPDSQRQKGSTYFPATLSGLYQAAQNMSTVHLQCGACSEMPESIRQKFALLISTKHKSSGAGRLYWEKAATKLGLIDSYVGIRFIRDEPPPTPSQQEQVEGNDLKNEELGEEQTSSSRAPSVRKRKNAVGDEETLQKGSKQKVEGL